MYPDLAIIAYTLSKGQILNADSAELANFNFCTRFCPQFFPKFVGRQSFCFFQIN